MYTETYAKVLSPDGETEQFEIKAGVLQGDTLAPYLFIIALDYAMRTALGGKEEKLGFHLKKRQGIRMCPVCLMDLDFADDIALVSNEIAQAQEMLERVETSAASVGLIANAKKTKVMMFNQPTGVQIKTKDDTVLEEVKEFTYLGSLVSSTMEDIRRRIALAWRACNKLNKIWKSPLSRNIKIRLFTSTVESVLLYGCESWTLTCTLHKKLNGTYTRLLRSALGFVWSDKISNEILYGNLPKVTDKIQSRRLKLAGHLRRHEEETANNLIFWDPQHGVRSRGRPVRTFINQLEEDTGLEAREVDVLMQDRDRWRTIAGRSLNASTR